MTDTRRQERNFTGAVPHLASRRVKARGRLAAILMTTLSAGLSLIASSQTQAQAVRTTGFTFVNAVDDTQGFLHFGSMPAINNDGAVAFESEGIGFASGSVTKWQDGRLTTIATSADNIHGSFGDTVIINADGRVGLSTKVLSSNDVVIATGDGGVLTTIASAQEQGLVGGGFLGISGMNESGTVVFVGLRRDFRSQVIFAGNGGPLTAIVDTATDPNFLGLRNADINASGKIVFGAFPADGSTGIFSSAGGRTQDLIDTNNPSFVEFIDPVINNRGIVAGGVFLSNGGAEVFSATAARITPRTDPHTASLTNVDNVSINNSGDVAFFATDAVGGAGIFVELTGGSHAIPVIHTGDSLFGSTVIAVSVGRFSVNDRGQIAFRYQLASGRSGIAVASRRY